MSLSFWGWTRWIGVLGLASMLLAGLIAAACGDGGGAGGVAAREVIERAPETTIVIPPGSPITIGVSVPLTGPDAALGSEDLNGVVVGVQRWEERNGKTIGGHEIEIHAADDGCSDADATAQAAGRLLRLTGLVGVMGPDCSGGASRVIPVYAHEGIVMISGSATRTDLTVGQTRPAFFFRTAHSNSQEADLQARYVATTVGAATAYVLDDSEPYGTDLANALQAMLAARGVEVGRTSVERGAVDFSEVADGIAAADPDVVIFEGFNPEAALLYRQSRDAGYGGPFVFADGVISVADFIEPLGGLAEGAVFAGCPLALPEKFLAEYVEAVGHTPTTPFVGHYADAATILLQAVTQVAVEQEDGSLAIEPLELRDAVSKAILPDGVSGSTAFDDNGDRLGWGASVGLAMCRIEGGRFLNFEF